MNVLIATRLDSIARETLEQHKGYVVTQVDAGDLTTLAATYPDVEALIVRSEAVTAEVIDAFPKLQIIVRAGSGYNTIDVRHARAKGIDVMNTPAANSNAVAEEVIALMLADARHIVEADQTTRAGMWEKKRLLGCEITGKTIGIVGLGYIGQLVARRLSGFDVRIVAADPLVTTARAEEFGVDLLELEAVFEQADYVTLHIPENDETRGLIGEALLAKMKPGATIINCARAGIIDEDALVAALEAGQIAGAALDVTEIEPLPAESSLWDAPNLLLTPHRAGASQHRPQVIVRFFQAQLQRYLDGERPRNVIDKRRGY